MRKATTAKKTTVKKPRTSSSKKSVSKSRKPLVVAEGETCFWVHEGPVLSHLRELHDAMWTMTSQQYQHHVRPEKNDFALWILHVLADEDTARKIERAETPAEAATILNEALEEYAL